MRMTLIIVDFINHIPYLYPMPPLSSIRAFNRFYTGFLGLLDRHILDSDFSLPEARVLYELRQKEGVQAAEIAERLGMDKGYLSRILDQFTDKKLIVRKRSEEDGRRMPIFLTEKGRKEFDKLNRSSDEQLKGLLGALPKGDWDRLQGHMTGIMALLGQKVKLEDIDIRTDLRPGDIGYVTYMHGRLYKQEYAYGVNFETYVAQGLAEFWKQYDPGKDRVWICSHAERIVGFLLLMHRGKDVAQLRYFILEPEYRGIGLGKKLMGLYMAYLKEKGYKSSYLWTTHELETAAALYTRHGFVLTEEKDSEAFGKALRERKYEMKL